MQHTLIAIADCSNLIKIDEPIKNEFAVYLNLENGKATTSPTSSSSEGSVIIGVFSLDQLLSPLQRIYRLFGSSVSLYVRRLSSAER